MLEVRHRQPRRPSQRPLRLLHRPPASTIDHFADLASIGGTLGPDVHIDLELIPTGQTVFDTQYAELAKRAENKARRIKADTAELEKIKAQLRELGKGSYMADGRTIVTVGGTPRRFDESLARSVLTLEQQAQVTKTVIDGAAVKVLFGDEVHDSCRKDQGGKATVKFPGVE